MYRLLCISIVAFIFAGCGSHDADYYTQHPDEMKIKMQQCARMSEAERMIDRECSAVVQAETKRMLDLKPPASSPLAGPGKGQGFKKFN